MDPRFSHLTHIFLDADDTLWENDIYFRKAEEEFVEYMSRYTSADNARTLLAEKQEENIPIFGYGSKTYLQGMLDAAAVIAPQEFGAKMYHDIKDIIVRLATHKFDWLPGAQEMVQKLSERYKVVIATKGELCEQLRKFRLSGLEDYVTAIEVMEKKSEGDYRNLAAKLCIKPENFFMVGNAVRSDIAPVIAMGGWAVHIPYAVTWVHEMMEMPQSDRIIELGSITQLEEILL